MTDKTQHTPEPWHVTFDAIHFYDIKDSKHKEVASTITSETTDEKNLANAKRIVECVNAMEGIESPQKLKDTWDAINLLKLDPFSLKEIKKRLIVAEESINGYLDAFEFDNTSDVIEKQSVLSMLRDLKRIIKPA